MKFPKDWVTTSINKKFVARLFKRKKDGLIEHCVQITYLPTMESEEFVNNHGLDDGLDDKT